MNHSYKAWVKEYEKRCQLVSPRVDHFLCSSDTEIDAKDQDEAYAIAENLKRRGIPCQIWGGPRYFVEVPQTVQTQLWI